MNENLNTVCDEVAEKNIRVKINYDYGYSESGYIHKHDNVHISYFFVKRINSQNIGCLGTSNIKEIIDVETKKVLYPVSQ